MTDFVPIVLWEKLHCGGEILKMVDTFAMRVAFISETILAQQDPLKDQKTTEWYIAGIFYNVKNGLSFITLKSSSKNLSNENKNWWKRGNIVCLFSFLRFFEKLFDVMNDGPFLTL